MKRPLELAIRWCFVVLPLSALPGTAWASDLELVLRGGPFVPTDGERSLATVGLEGGAAALLRFSDHFAAGLVLDTAWIGWSARASADGIPATTQPTLDDPGGDPLGFPDPDGRVRSTLHALSLRWYPLSTRTLQPYLDASFGWLSVVERPDHPDCGDGSGPSGQLGLGLDGSLSSAVRVGGLLGARPFRMGRGCHTLYYPGMPPSPPRGGLAVSAQVVLTSVWSSR